MTALIMEPFGPEVIQDKLDSSDTLILVMSPRSFEFFLGTEELDRARENGKPIFPLLLKGGNGYRFKHFNMWMFAINPCLPKNFISVWKVSRRAET